MIELGDEERGSQATQLRKSIDESLKRLAEAIDEQQASGEMQCYLNLLAPSHKYSWRNALLIALAKPESTLVAGFHAWKKMGRKVKKGEKAIRIFASCPVVQVNEDEEEVERMFFRTACVFDVSQTEGQELPILEIPNVQIQADKLLHRLEQGAALRGIQVEYREFKDGLYGVSKGGLVAIARGYSTGQQAKTLAHELAHETLHKVAERQSLSREVMELEAEAVAYVVCRHFGLDVELRASRYIATWGGDGKALAKSLDRISRTARGVIEGVETASASR